ncbi:GDP-L-fucose synthase [Pirellulimonas nuda]|uniref:GDP-L-fucose synthase n=1 Tax=Pirellulimonas nuda TaxID=2528009 RepID=A0A518DJ85_9BACT|nr:GDP-L-fucose synthase [Pirellulimonas nuda]QDU91502.1 GDP-L-fucose synthase [Pirellulimonas nuda]
MIDRNASIFVTGHRGMVGSALVRRLEGAGFERVLTAGRKQLDLRDQAAVDQWFDEHRPAYVMHAAGTVGGIHANRSRPADFLYDNLMIHATVLRAAWRTQVQKLLYLGSSCIYPRDCPQPIREEYLLTGPLEKTNDAYAIAKISGLMSCDAYRRQYDCHFIAAMPTNLYGPNDNFDLEGSHVLPALIRKFHDCREAGGGTVTVWGSGSPMREFLHVDDLADACLYLLENYDNPAIINVGTGEDLAIRELAELVREVVYPEAELTFDASMPDGTPRKLLDVSRLHSLGWKARIGLREGIESSYRWFLENAPRGVGAQV